MAAETLRPDGELSDVGLVASDYTDHDADPDSDSTTTAATGNNVNTQYGVDFPTPGDPPTVGAGLQEFRAGVEEFAPGQSGTPDARIELWENGSLVRAGSNVPVLAFAVLAFTWDANELATADGSLVQCKVIGVKSGGGPSARNTVNIGQIEWNAETSAGSVALVVQDADHNHAADAPTLTQHNALAVQDAAHGHSADGPALTQHNVLAVDEALHGHSSDAIPLTQHNVLAVDGAGHAHSADNVVLTAYEPGASLVVQEALHDHLADSPSLVQHNVLAVGEALHSHAADEAALIQHNVLAVQGGLHSHLADNLVLTAYGPSVALVVQDGLHGHLAGNLVLTQHGVLAVDDALHAHASDNLALTHNPVGGPPARSGRKALIRISRGYPRLRS